MSYIENRLTYLSQPISVHETFSSYLLFSKGFNTKTLLNRGNEKLSLLKKTLPTCFLQARRVFADSNKSKY